MTTIREAVRQSAAESGLTPNALAAMVAGQVSRTQVYDFFNGRHDLTTEKADTLLAALGLLVIQPPRAFVVQLRGLYWNGDGFGNEAKLYATHSEAVEAAQEDAALPPDEPWSVVVMLLVPPTPRTDSAPSAAR